LIFYILNNMSGQNWCKKFKHKIFDDRGSIYHAHFVFKIIVIIDFLGYFLLSVLFKILFQICQIISHDSILFHDTMDYNKIYDKF
jgi:hypothetical protein